MFRKLLIMENILNFHQLGVYSAYLCETVIFLIGLFLMTLSVSAQALQNEEDKFSMLSQLIPASSL